MKARWTFGTPLLGTVVGNPEVATDYISSKHPDGVQADEVEALPSAAEIEENIEEETRNKTTYFYRQPGGTAPVVMDYQIKGHFKGAMDALLLADEYTKKELKKFGLTRYMYKRSIDKLVFPAPRFIPVVLPDGVTELSFVERPLRGETAKGERIALARSEAVPIGSYIEFEIDWLGSKLDEWIPRWLDYGKLGGFLQWRSGGYGRFTWEDLTPVVKA